MKRTILISLLILIYINGFTQSVRIEGRIIDNTTNKPISFASISVKNSSSGTMADENGYFIICVSDKYKELEFSHISYKKITIGIENLKKNKRIKLSPKMKELKEVTIDGLTPKKILFNALKAVPNNYIKEEYYAEIEILHKKNDDNKLSFLSFNDGIYLCRGALSYYKVMKPKLCHAYYSDSTILFKYNRIEPDLVIGFYKKNKKELEKNDMSIFDGLNFKMQTIYDDLGNEQDYIITTSCDESKLSNKKFRGKNLPIINNYYIDANSFAIKQVEILQDTTKMEYTKIEGLKVKIIGMYQIVNYQKNDSVYLLANSLSKFKYEQNVSKSNSSTKKRFDFYEDDTVKLIEKIDIYRVKNISNQMENLQLELAKDVYMPLDEMRKIELFSPLFMDTIKYRYE